MTLYIGLCPSLYNIANGVTTLNSKVEGSVATFSCNSGYGMVGSPSSTCRSNGEWTPIPTCNRETIEIYVCIQWNLNYPDLDYPDPRLSGLERIEIASNFSHMTRLLLA